MSAVGVARDDFRNARRSWAVRGVVGAFVALVALLFLVGGDVHPHPYRTLYDVTRAFILVAPILLAPLAYAAVVGDRTSGRLRFVLGLPRSRGAYLAGVFASRVGVAALAVVASVAVGFVVALATYANPPAVGRFLAFVVASTLYVVAFTSIFVAISALAPSRATAVLGAVGAYFLLVPFWIGILPPVGLDSLLTAVGDLLGTTVSEETRDFAQALSPYGAYGRAVEPVFANAADQYEVLHDSPEDDLHDYLWFDALVLVAWTALSGAVSYAGFARADLGS